MALKIAKLTLQGITGEEAKETMVLYYDVT